MASSMLLNRRVVSVSASMRASVPGARMALPVRRVVTSATVGPGGPTGSGPDSGRETVGGVPTGRIEYVPNVPVSGGGSGPSNPPGGRGGSGGSGRSDGPSGSRAPEPAPGGRTLSDYLKMLAFLGVCVAIFQVLRPKNVVATKDAVVGEAKELGREARDLGAAAKHKAKDAKDAAGRAAHNAKESGKDAMEAAKLKAKEAKDAAAHKAQEAQANIDAKAKQTAIHVANKEAEAEARDDHGVVDNIKGAAASVGRALNIGAEKAEHAAKQLWEENVVEVSDSTNRKRLAIAGGSAVAIGLGAYLLTKQPWNKGGDGKPSSGLAKEPAGPAGEIRATKTVTTRTIPLATTTAQVANAPTGSIATIPIQPVPTK